MEFFLFSSYVIFVLSTVDCSRISINDYGGYDDITVAIQQNYDEVTTLELLQKLEGLFRDSSRLLHASTRKLVYFNEISFLLPRNTNTTLLKERNISFRTKSFLNPDIIILDTGLFGNNPYTIQHGWCAEEGLRINIPAAFLESYESSIKAQAFIHEWAHYRYGVFDEHGFPNDPLYPLLYWVPGENDANAFFVPGCTDKKAFYKFLDTSGHKCEPASSSCFPVPEYNSRNDAIASSLMHRPFFPKVSQFCDSFQHNRNAPTKQNALCKERSTWEIISAHKDLQDRRYENQYEATSPKFKYLVESELRIILAIEASRNMAVNGRMELVQNAFSYFVLYDLPQDGKIGLTELKNDNFLPELIPADTPDRIFNIFPQTHEETDVCVHCGIYKAIKAFSEVGGFILLVSTTDISEVEEENAKQTLLQNEVKLFVIFFNSSASFSSVPRLEKLAKSSGGEFFIILEKQYGDSQKRIPSLTILYEVFRSVYQAMSWTLRNKVLVDQKIFLGNGTEGTMSFVVDESMEFLHVLLTGSNFRAETGPPIIKKKLVLQNENTTYTLFDHQFFSYKIKIPAFMFAVPNPQVGTWNLTFTKKTGFIKPIVSIVRAFKKSSSEIITMHCWVSEEKMPGGRIYAELLKGIYPVINASVTAEFHHHRLDTKVVLELFDTGEENPDITKNDGIYSRYLTGLELSGYYTVTVTARRNVSHEGVHTIQDDNARCCGSVMPTSTAARSDAFTRIASCGTIYIHEMTVTKAPPRRITDFHVAHVQAFSHGVKHYTLQWTAPGDSYDAGQAAEYEMKVFRSREDALNNFTESQVLVIDEWKTHGPWLKPETAGRIQTLIIQLSNLTTGNYFLSMRTISNKGSVSDISNVVEIYYIEPATLIQLSTTTSFTLQTENGSTAISEVKQQADSDNVGLIIGITCGALFLLLLLGFVLLLILSRRKFAEKQKKNESNSIYVRTWKRESNDVAHAPSATSIPENPRNSEVSEVVYFTPYSSQTYRENQKRLFNQYATPSTEAQVQQDNASIVSEDSISAYAVGNFCYNNEGLYDVPRSSQLFQDGINLPFNPSHTSSLRRSSEERPYKLGTDV